MTAQQLLEELMKIPEEERLTLKAKLANVGPHDEDMDVSFIEKDYALLIY
jgi:hypothetical protein